MPSQGSPSVKPLPKFQVGEEGRKGWRKTSTMWHFCQALLPGSLAEWTFEPSLFQYSDDSPPLVFPEVQLLLQYQLGIKCRPEWGWQEELRSGCLLPFQECGPPNAHCTWRRAEIVGSLLSLANHFWFHRIVLKVEEPCFLSITWEYYAAIKERSQGKGSRRNC